MPRVQPVSSFLAAPQGVAEKYEMHPDSDPRRLGKDGDVWGPVDGFMEIWVNLITTSLFSLTGIMVNKGNYHNYPQMTLIQVGEIL